MDNSQVLFPYYSGNIFLVKCLGLVSLNSFIEAHRNPNPRTERILKEIRECEIAGDKEAKRQKKQSLYSFTPSVLIPKGYKRKYENIESWTGLMQLDFDKLPDAETALELKYALFNNYKEIITAYLSPSMKGVKCIMKIKIPKSKDHFKALHRAVSEEMEQYSYFDNATTNAMLPLFLSVDKDILSRDISKCFTWEHEDWSEPEYVELNEEPPTSILYDFNESLRNKTIRIFTNKINEINSDGHPQLRSACLILGSRVGANYISEFEARHMAENLINCNSYLQKDLSNYKRTAVWAIHQGMQNPKYYK